ncbi:MAG: hypothetical protein OXH04_05785 [Acidobacteria bacterium]|nr:hypothetical protein [Acidobacteriota bacterium]
MEPAAAAAAGGWTSAEVVTGLVGVITLLAVLVGSVLQYRANRDAHAQIGETIKAVDARAEERDRGLVVAVGNLEKRTRRTAEDVAYLRGRFDGGADRARDS